MSELRSGRTHEFPATNQPWDRQPRESSRAFAAFAIYRDLASKRTYQQVANRLGCNGSNIRRWASEWAWYARAFEWDKFLDQLDRETYSYERHRMSDRLAKEGMALQAIGMDGLQKLQERVRKNEHRLTTTECVRLIEGGARIEREARGEPDQQQVPKMEVIYLWDAPPPDEPATHALASTLAVAR